VAKSAVVAKLAKDMPEEVTHRLTVLARALHAAPDDEAFRGAGELAAQAASPGSDLRGTVDYKRNVIRTFTERGLRNAAAIAANNQGGA